MKKPRVIFAFSIYHPEDNTFYEKIYNGPKHWLDTFKQYAKKVDADLIVNTELTYSKTFFERYPDGMYHMDFEKLCMIELAELYDRILYLDTDILITPHAKDIFKELDPNYTYMLDETKFSRVLIPSIQDRLGLGYKVQKYYNAGVVITSKEHRLLDIDINDLWMPVSYPGQAILNFSIHKNKVPIKELPKIYNWMGEYYPHGGKNAKRLKEASFIHYCGNSMCSMQAKSDLMLKEFKAMYKREPENK